MGNLPEAIKAYKKGLEVDPNNAQLQAGLKEVQDATLRSGAWSVFLTAGWPVARSSLISSPLSSGTV